MKNFNQLKPILKKSKKGFIGYPLATLAFYGPTNKLATKAVLGVFQHEHDEPLLVKWYSEKIDIRAKSIIIAEILMCLKQNHISSLLLKDKIYGCPHEEGIDYPIDNICDKCPYWANVDRETNT